MQLLHLFQGRIPACDLRRLMAMDVTEEQQRQGRFWRKYLRLTRAGVGTLRALEIMIDEEPDPGFKVVVIRMHEALAESTLLSECMAEFPERFSRSVRELIRTAEKEGHWDLVLEELSAGLLDGTFD